jgi:hypothetical protein
MRFLEVIIENSSVKEAKLYGPSKKASERPETGITIQTPAAFHVIKDCARFTNQYLPHFIFGSYANPLEILKGKFTKEEIVEFITAARSDIILFQLLTLILDKIRKTDKVFNMSTSISDFKTSDPYGEYESYTDSFVQETQDPLILLCSAFGV